MMLADPPDAYGILYAEDFDEPAPVPVPPPPLFTAGERDAVVNAACTAAVAEAQAAWAQSDQQRRTGALASLANAFQSLQAAVLEQQEAIAGETARTMLTVLATMLPALSAQHGPAEVAALLRSVLPRLSQPPHITLRVAPGTMEQVRPELMLLDDTLATAITLLPDARLAAGDVRLAWPGGTLVRDTAAIADAVLAAIQAALPALSNPQQEAGKPSEPAAAAPLNISRPAPAVLEPIPA